MSGLGRVWRLFGRQDITLEALVSVDRLSEHLAIEPLQVAGVDHEGRGIDADLFCCLNGETML